VGASQTKSVWSGHKHGPAVAAAFHIRLHQSHIRRSCKHTITPVQVAPTNHRPSVFYQLPSNNAAIPPTPTRLAPMLAKSQAQGGRCAYRRHVARSRSFRGWVLLQGSVVDCGPGSSGGIATDYGMDCPGSNPGGDEVFRPSRLALGPT